MPEDVLDILLTLSNLRGFVAGSREAAASVRSIGTAAKEGSAQASAASTRMSGVAGLASKAMKGTAVAVAAFGYESTKMAINFDKQMEMVHTQAGASQQEVTNMSKAILTMSASGLYAQGPEKLSEGLFHLESIGLRGKRALDALKIAAQGAAVGNADLEDTTTALGSAWLVNIKGGGDLNHVMALLNATVGAGNTRMGDLVHALGTGVLASAKLAGLGINDVMGALATLTDEGYQASSASAQLATSFHFLTDPTTKAKKALAQMGLTASSLSDTMRTRGLPAALSELRDHLNQFGPARSEQLLGDILPAGRGRVLEVLMNQVDRYGRKINQIDHTSKNFAQDVAATHRTASFRIHAAWSQIQADMIHVGHLLEPLAVTAAVAFSHLVTWIIKVAPGLAHIIPYLVPLVAGFVAFRLAVLGAAAAEVLFNAAGFVAAIISLIPAITSLKDAWILLDMAMNGNAIALVIAAIVAIGVALVLAYNHVAWFRNAVNAVWHWLKTATEDTIGAVVAAFHWMTNAAGNVATFVRAHWRQLILVFGFLGLAIDFVTRHWKWFSAAGKFAWNILSAAARFAWNSVIKPVFNWIVGAGHWVFVALGKVFGAIAGVLIWPFKWAWNNVIKPILNAMVAAFRWVAHEIEKVWHKITGPLSAVGHWFGGAAGTVGKFLGISGAASGGTVTSGGPLWVGERGPELLNLPRGATVVPLASGDRKATGALSTNFTIVVPVSIDRREVARATGKYVDDRLARQ